MPVTGAAIAYVVAQHTGEPGVAYPFYDERFFSKDAVSAELRYANSDAQSDGDMVRVVVGTKVDRKNRNIRCDRVNVADGCEETDRGTLSWQDVAPEEDPGIVWVIVTKAKATIQVTYAGPTITEDRDPRDLHLPIPVETLFDIANDPRIDITTSQDAVDAAEGLEYWENRPVR